MAIYHSKFALWLRDLLADKKFRELRLRHERREGMRHGRIPLLAWDRAAILARSGQRIGKNALALLAPLLMRDIERAIEDDAIGSPHDAPGMLQRFVIDAYFGTSEAPLRKFPMRYRTKVAPDAPPIEPDAPPPAPPASPPPPPPAPPRPFAGWFDTVFAGAPNLRGVAERLLDMAAVFLPGLAGALAQDHGEASRMLARLDLATVYRATRVLPMERQREAIDLFLALQAIVPPAPQPNTIVENEMMVLFGSFKPEQFHQLMGILYPHQQAIAWRIGLHFKKKYDEAQAQAHAQASAKKETK